MINENRNGKGLIMIIRCPNCNGALEFDIEQGLLYCKFCGSFHTPKDLDLPETNTEENSSESGAMPEDEEIEIDPEILAATTELNETFLGSFADSFPLEGEAKRCGAPT